MKEKLRKNFRLFADNAYNLVALSIITGIFAGAVVTFYNILMSFGEGTAEKLYALLRDYPAYIPLLFIGLCAGAIFIGTVVRFVPMIRGSGIPQIEGAARGIVRFKWYVTMCSMFAMSLACVFMGYPAGAEGPSLEIGGCAGSAVGVILKRNSMVKRLQIAGGASAGLAVAFNAPITGMVFALEEAFRSFSPQVFICSAISVVSAIVTRNAIRYPILGENSVGFSFTEFHFAFAFDGEGAIFCLWVVVAAIIAALVGMAFYHLVFSTKKLLKKITLLKGAFKYIIPFIVAGAFALLTKYSIGGGHSFIDDLATEGGLREMPVERMFGLGLTLTLVIIVVMRLITSVLSMSCGVPCGVFIPMLAIGAGVGAVLSILFQKAGMPAEYSDYLVIISMAALFTSVVKAPITGLVMIYELTGQFVNPMPALLGVMIGLLVGKTFSREAIYEKALDGFIKEEKLYEKVRKEIVTLKIMEGAQADGLAIRTVIWPTNGLVTAVIHADGEKYVPDGETVLRAGESIVFECETDDRSELLNYLEAVVGKQEKSE